MHCLFVILSLEIRGGLILVWLLSPPPCLSLSFSPSDLFRCEIWQTLVVAFRQVVMKSGSREAAPTADPWATGSTSLTAANGLISKCQQPSFHSDGYY